MGVANSDRLPSLTLSAGDAEEPRADGIIEPIGWVGVGPPGVARIAFETAESSL